MSADNGTGTIGVLYSPWPDTESATEAARTLIDEGVCACVNIIPRIISVYRWNGDVQTDDECVMLIKVPVDGVTRARQRIEQLHPYDTPCVLVADEVPANRAFADWALTQTTGLSTE